MSAVTGGQPAVFRCEICSLQIPLARKESHVSSKIHLNNLFLMEKGQWPGKGKLGVFRVYNFVDSTSGRITCNACNVILNCVMSLCLHQRLSEHIQQVIAKNAYHAYPVLYHCEICMDKRLLTKADYDMHSQQIQHSAEVAEFNRQLSLELKEKTKGPAALGEESKASVEGSSASNEASEPRKIPEQETGVPSWNSFFGPVVDQPSSFGPGGSGKTLFLRFGPEILTETHLLTLCAPFGTVVKHVMLRKGMGLVEFSTAQEAQRMVVTVSSCPPICSNGYQLQVDYSNRGAITEDRRTPLDLQRKAYFLMCNRDVGFTSKSLLPEYQMPPPLSPSYLSTEDPNTTSSRSIVGTDASIMEPLPPVNPLSMTELELSRLPEEVAAQLKEDLRGFLNAMHKRRTTWMTSRISEIEAHVKELRAKGEKENVILKKLMEKQRILKLQARLDMVLKEEQFEKLHKNIRSVILDNRRLRAECQNRWTLAPDLEQRIAKLSEESKKALLKSLDHILTPEIQTRLPQLVEKYQSIKRKVGEMKSEIKAAATERLVPLVREKTRRLKAASDCLLMCRIVYVVKLGLVYCFRGEVKAKILEFCASRYDALDCPASEEKQIVDLFAVLSKDPNPDGVVGTFAHAVAELFPDISLVNPSPDFCVLCRKDVRGEGFLRVHVNSREHKSMLVIAAHGLWPGPQAEDCIPQWNPKPYSFDNNQYIECRTCQLKAKGSVELLRHQRTQIHCYKLAERMGPEATPAIMYCEICEVFMPPSDFNAFANHQSSLSHKEMMRHEKMESGNMEVEHPEPEQPIPPLVSLSQVRGLKEHEKSLLESTLRPVTEPGEICAVPTRLRALRSMRNDMKDYAVVCQSRDETKLRLQRLETAEKSGQIERGSTSHLRAKFLALQEEVVACLIKDQINYLVYHGLLRDLPEEPRNIIIEILASKQGEAASTSHGDMLELSCERPERQYSSPSPRLSEEKVVAESGSQISDMVQLPHEIHAKPTQASLSNLLGTFLPENKTPSFDPDLVREALNSKNSSSTLELIQQMIAKKAEARSRRELIDKLIGKLATEGFAKPPGNDSHPPKEDPLPPPMEEGAREKALEQDLEETLKRARWKATEAGILETWDGPRMCWVWDGDDVRRRQFLHNSSAFYKALQDKEDAEIAEVQREAEGRKRALLDSIADARVLLASTHDQEYREESSSQRIRNSSGRYDDDYFLEMADYMGAYEREDEEHYSRRERYRGSRSRSRNRSRSRSRSRSKSGSKSRDRGSSHSRHRSRVSRSRRS